MGRRSESGQAHHCASSHLRQSYYRGSGLAGHPGSPLGMDDFAATSHYKYLLDDPEFRRFLQNVRRRSENSASELLRRFGMIHKRFHKLPADFAKMNTKQAKHASPQDSRLLVQVQKITEPNRSESWEATPRVSVTSQRRKAPSLRE
jgi:hypothetical protein